MRPVALAVSLETLTQDTLRTFEINGPDFHQYDETIELSNVAGPIFGMDSLGAALRVLALRTNITQLIITDSFLVSSSLFWPKSAGEAHTLSWPSLEQFTVEMCAFNPDGDWYFVEDPENGWLSDVSSDEEESDEQSDDGGFHDFGEGDESDSDTDTSPRRFRSIPDAKSINPLLLAMARAASCMPSIREFSLGLRYGWEELYDRLTRIHSFRGFFVELLVDSQTNKKLVWSLGDWRPSEEVETAWRDVLGPSGTIEYTPVPENFHLGCLNRRKVSA